MLRVTRDQRVVYPLSISPREHVESMLILINRVYNRGIRIIRSIKAQKKKENTTSIALRPTFESNGVYSLNEVR
jgi:hypothetical protein